MPPRGVMFLAPAAFFALIVAARRDSVRLPKYCGDNFHAVAALGLVVAMYRWRWLLPARQSSSVDYRRSCHQILRCRLASAGYSRCCSVAWRYVIRYRKSKTRPAGSGARWRYVG